MKRFSRLMRRLLPRRLGAMAFARDERGITPIEFAVAAPFLLIVMMGAIEVCFDMMMDNQLQIATQEAGRAGMTTVVPTGSTRDAQTKQILNTVLGPWLKLSGTTMTYSTVSYSSYGAMATPSAGTSGSQGGYGDVVIYNVSMTTTGMTGILKALGIKTLTFSRSFMVQNEK